MRTRYCSKIANTHLSFRKLLRRDGEAAVSWETGRIGVCDIKRCARRVGIKLWTCFYIACPHATMRASAKVSEAFAVLGLEEVRSLIFLLFSDISHPEIGILPWPCQSHLQAGKKKQTSRKRVVNAIYVITRLLFVPIRTKIQKTRAPLKSFNVWARPTACS